MSEIKCKHDIDAMILIDDGNYIKNNAFNKGDKMKDIDFYLNELSYYFDKDSETYHKASDEEMLKAIKRIDDVFTKQYDIVDSSIYKLKKALEGSE